MRTPASSPSAPQGHADSSSVLIVSRELDPVGSGRQIELLAAGLARAGLDVHLALLTAATATDSPAAPQSACLSGRVAAAGGQVHRLGTRPVPDAAAILRLVRLAAALRPAVVVLSGRRLLQIAPALRAILRRVRLVAWIAVPFRHRSSTLALHAVDLVIASSSGVAASTRGGAAVEIIPPGVTVDVGSGLDRQDVGRRLGLDPAMAWTVCVAPLEPEAHLDRLLWAIDQLGVVHRGIAHLLVGSGPLLRRVRRRAHVQQLADRLVVQAHCPLLPDLLAHARLVWQSGEVAGGGAILDGMARGVPAVMVESDAARQLVVDGETGCIVPPVPESEFPRRTLTVIEDDALASRWGAAAAARAATDFSADRLIERWLAVIDRGR